MYELEACRQQPPSPLPDRVQPSLNRAGKSSHAAAQAQSTIRTLQGNPKQRHGISSRAPAGTALHAPPMRAHVHACMVQEEEETPLKEIHAPGFRRAMTDRELQPLYRWAAAQHSL